MSQLINLLVYNPEQPLLFTQLFFWVFFTLALAVFSIIYKNNRVRTFFLLLFSLYFYYKTGGYFFFLLLFSTIIDYLLGLAIYNSTTPLKRRFFLILSLISNLGILAYFKYAYFLTETLNSLFSTNLKVVNYLALWSNNLTGTDFNVSTIILPVGISFYTFQTISYTMDVYRKRIPALHNIIDFAFFVTFFPQLVAGPIVRAAQFIPQLTEKYNLTIQQVGHALFLIINGLIKKMLISDYISVNFVDRVFDNPNGYSGIENLWAVYGYSVQIYCDFSGYTDIAIGTALMLGFTLPLNFYSPYKATSITDFWRRWHISLSTWLRDYLYIPLGGNKRGKIRTYLNLFVTMLLGGLWHGAGLRFIIWGGLHGVALAFHKLWSILNPWQNQKNKYLQFLSVFVTFNFVSFLWIPFRASNMDSVSAIINQIFYSLDLSLMIQLIFGYPFVFIAITTALIIHWLPASFKETYRGWFIKTPWVVKLIILLLLTVVLYQSRTSGLQPFIYFQF